jgi:class 3 adenylate cyclase
MVEKTQRRLAAIIAADVAGYTRLMRLDEEATMAAFSAPAMAAQKPNIVVI